MALKNTNLTIQLAPLPATFRGTPQDFAAQMVLRMKILSPSGSTFIFIGDNKPTSNVGPWLKGGTQWWVWDPAINDYVPLDISASFVIPFWISLSQPPGINPPVWLQTSQDATDINANHGDPIRWMSWNGAAWVPVGSGVLSGAVRPANPFDKQLFFDESIGVLIWFERGQWRTFSGVPGDIKSVIFSTLVDAINHNPGWAVLGDTAPQLIGRTISQATKDPGLTAVSVLTPVGAVPARDAFETFGENVGVAVDPALTTTLPAEVALWHLYKL